MKRKAFLRSIKLWMNMHEVGFKVFVTCSIVLVFGVIGTILGGFGGFAIGVHIGALVIICVEFISYVIPMIKDVYTEIKSIYCDEMKKLDMAKSKKDED